MSKIVQLPSKRQHMRPIDEAINDINEIALRRGAKRHLATAIVEAKRAVAVAPGTKELWNNLATFFWADRQYDEGLACIDRALKIDPTFYKAFHNKGLIMESLGHYDEAEDLFARAVAADPKYLNVIWCRSMMRLARGDYARGWPEYETRIPFRQSEGKEVYPKFPAPYWKGEDIRGKRVFCCIEQGIGDTIMFSRFLPWLKEQVGPDGKVYLCCAHELMVLLWEFHLAGFVDAWVPEGIPIPECDYSVVTGSLPFHSQCTLDSLPADPGLIRKRAETQMRIGPAAIPRPLGPDPFKVGICWTGNPEQERNAERTIPLELLLSLAEHPNVWLYSLQVNGSADIARLGAEDIVCDLGPQLKARGLTVASTALLQMDLVVTCCTSIVHLAGALGLPAWVLLCKVPYWVWMHDRADSPWYPSLKLYRQSVTDDWKSVVQTVRDDLIDLVDARRPKLASTATKGD